MTEATASQTTLHPNPFTLAQINHFYRKSGFRIKIFSSRNLYVIHKKEKPWVRITYLPRKKEWFFDSWQAQALIIPCRRYKRPHQARLNCWRPEESGLTQLSQVLEGTLKFVG